MKNIKARQKSISRYLQKRFSLIGYSYSDIFFRVLVIIFILALGVNIYNSYQKGQNNLKRIQDEEEKLIQLIQENEDLKELAKYYESIEFRKSYARENWNLAEPGERLFYVEREKQLEIEYLEENEDPIIITDNAYWWQKLILGI